MRGMPSAESDLVIVSLVRYADSCDPARRHSDCPFAVENHGKLTCHEECRGVIRSRLRRGRGSQLLARKHLTRGSCGLASHVQNPTFSGTRHLYFRWSWLRLEAPRFSETEVLPCAVW